MDDIVRQALAKWPDVPACYGWLGLDARGHWYLRDAEAQASGSFESGRPGAKGSRLEHVALIAFIQRNYEPDERGQWYFQNGPQRVYVELEATPWIVRIAPDGSLSTHDGRPTNADRCIVDEAGRAYLLTDCGLALVHTQDIVLLADALERERWATEVMVAQDLPARFGFVRKPGAASFSPAHPTSNPT